MKLKLTIIIALFNVMISILHAQDINNSSKRIKIYNPTEQQILKLQQLGIDLSCGVTHS